MEAEGKTYVCKICEYEGPEEHFWTLPLGKLNGKAPVVDTICGECAKVMRTEDPETFLYRLSNTLEVIRKHEEAARTREQKVKNFMLAAKVRNHFGDSRRA